MKLVIDTNRIMAGLLKDSTSRKIILHDSFSFYAPEIILRPSCSNTGRIL